MSLPASSPPDGDQVKSRYQHAPAHPGVTALDACGEDSLRFYREVVALLERADVPFLFGGAYAFERYTDIVRHTKDLDIFIRPSDLRATLKTLAAGRLRTEVTDRHWLAKAWYDEDFIDIIFSSGNGLCQVDDLWFERSVPAEVLEMPVRLVPPEEMIWQKAFIQERERYDGADVAHLLRASGPTLDWAHLLDRFGEHWRVLLSHLTLFGYVYPTERDKLPAWVLDQLLGRLERESQSPPPRRRVSRGPLLSRYQYRPDLERWGYHPPTRLARSR